MFCKRSTQAEGCATKNATTTFGYASVTLLLRFGQRYKSLFSRYKPFGHEHFTKADVGLKILVSMGSDEFIAVLAL